MPDSRLARFAWVVGLLALGSGAGWLVARRVPTSPLSLLPPITQKHDEVKPTATVLVAVRNLARLESVSFHMERVIDFKSSQSHLYGLLQGDDALLLVAAGDVVAGVDLTKMRDGDVMIEPTAHRAYLTLPEPELLLVRLDNQRTYVHSRKTDVFAQRDIELETKARQEAEGSIRDAALNDGILTKARANAAQTLTALVRSLGYDQVIVTWRGE